MARRKSSLREMPNLSAIRSAALKSGSGIDIAVFILVSTTGVISASRTFFCGDEAPCAARCRVRFVATPASQLGRRSSWFNTSRGNPSGAVKLAFPIQLRWRTRTGTGRSRSFVHRTDWASDDRARPERSRGDQHELRRRACPKHII